MNEAITYAALAVALYLFLLGMKAPIGPKKLQGSKTVACLGLAVIIVTAWVMTPKLQPATSAAAIAAQHLKQGLKLPLDQSGMELRDITAEGEKLVYAYRIPHGPEVSRRTADLLSAQMAMNACERGEYRSLLKQGIHIEMRYEDEKGAPAGGVTVSPVMCKNL